MQSKGLSSLLQHHSSKASILRCSAFFTVQLSHPNMTTGKTIALTRRTFVSKVMSLLFNMLCRLVITFLTNSKHLLISWLQSPSAVILEPLKIKSDNVSTVSASISHEVMQQRMSAGGCNGTRARPRGATPRSRSGVAAKRSYPKSEVRGSGGGELLRI